MTSRYAELEIRLQDAPLRWLVTGGAGFIGSHLVERLLMLGQTVRCVDDFSTGLHSNLAAVHAAVGDERFARFELVQADLADPGVAAAAVVGMDRVVHQAALGSVPRSVAQPNEAYKANVLAFFELLEACRLQGIRRVVFASSSSIYGDNEKTPKLEQHVGHMLSPYAATKAMNELWAQSYVSAYGMELVGLRYFNVCGPRQRPDGPYAAVVPAWIGRMYSGQAPIVYGDGLQSRDFTPIELVVQANLVAAAMEQLPTKKLLTCNVALGKSLNLIALEQILRAGFERYRPEQHIAQPEFRPVRTGDVLHSLADVSVLRNLLGGLPPLSLDEALTAMVQEACR